MVGLTSVLAAGGFFNKLGQIICVGACADGLGLTKIVGEVLKFE